MFALSALAAGCALIDPHKNEILLIERGIETIRDNHVDPVSESDLRIDCERGMRTVKTLPPTRAGASIEEMYKTTVAPATPEERSLMLTACLQAMIDGLSARSMDMATAPRPVQPPAAFAARSVDGFLYLRVPVMAADTAASVANVLNAPARGAVLDFRGNEGGLLVASVALSAAFLPRGVLVVETRGRSADSNKKLEALPRDYVRTGQSDPFEDLPAAIKTMRIAVLVDGGVEGASEIVAAALQDHRRALVIGTPTGGRGRISTLMPVRGFTQYRIRVPTARYFRIDGTPLKGVTPDRTRRFVEPHGDILSDETIRDVIAEMQKPF